MTAKVLAISGSLRKDSVNFKLLEVAVSNLRQQGIVVDQLSQEDLQLDLYNYDIEAQSFPAKVLKLKERFKDADALLFASPEHNSTYTSALKNLIDWVSRPTAGEGSLAAFDGKLACILSASPGALGGLRGLAQLRVLLENIKVMVIPDQFALTVSADTFTADGLKPEVQPRLEAVLNKFVQILKKIKV